MYKILLLKVPHSSKLVSREDLFGIKPAPPSRQALPKALKVSIQRHLVASLRPETKPSLKVPSPQPPATTAVTRFLTKAEKKADAVSHHLRHERERHGPDASTGGGGGGGGLIVTQGETKSVPTLLPAAAPSTPSASPSPSPEDDHQVHVGVHVHARHPNGSSLLYWYYYMYTCSSTV